jgi:hypothetical protein
LILASLDSRSRIEKELGPLDRRVLQLCKGKHRQALRGTLTLAIREPDLSILCYLTVYYHAPLQRPLSDGE